MACRWCHNPEGISGKPQLLFRNDLCVSCRICLKACTHKAISAHNDRIIFHRENCIACGSCSILCPANAREICGVEMTVDEIVKAVLADEPFFNSGNFNERGGVTLSGGEPLEQPEFCIALLKSLGQKGIHRVIDTSGNVPEETILEAASQCELFLYDIKHMDTEKHREFTGSGNELILSNLEKLSQSGSSIQLRLPFIPGINTDDENIRSVAELASSLNGITGINILPFHKAAIDKYRRWGITWASEKTPIPSEAELKHALELFAEKGLAAVIGG